jgi:uncharacterized glyoxalase superfamily protein PhnB
MTSHIPPGRPAVIPRLFTADVAGLAHFMREVFAAEGDDNADAPTELFIGGSPIMVSDGGGARTAQGAVLYVYVADVDAAVARAAALGAKMVEAPVDTPWGDRRGIVEDRWNNSWQIATHRPRT